MKICMSRDIHKQPEKSGIWQGGVLNLNQAALVAEAAQLE